MHSVSQVLSTKNEVLTSTKYLSNQDIKIRVTLLGEGLISEQWVAWYCKAYKTIGEQRFCGAVSMAKSGKDPKTLFGWLLKQEMAKYT